jgi:hypothetical protein
MMVAGGSLGSSSRGRKVHFVLSFGVGVFGRVWTLMNVRKMGELGLRGTIRS